VEDNKPDEHGMARVSALPIDMQITYQPVEIIMITFLATTARPLVIVVILTLGPTMMLLINKGT
jgi:hypothetical protein